MKVCRRLDYKQNNWISICVALAYLKLNIQLYKLQDGCFLKKKFKDIVLR